MDRTTDRFIESVICKWCVFISTLIVVGLLLVFELSALSETDWSTITLALFSVSVMGYIFFDMLAGPIANGLWSGYLLFITSTVWLALGLVPAIMMLVVGGSLRVLTQVWMVPSSQRVNALFVGLDALLLRIATLGLATLTSHLIYAGLGGGVPISSLSLEQVIILGFALFVGLGVTQVIGLLVIKPKYRTVVRNRLFWQMGGADRIFAEILLLVVAPVLAIIANFGGFIIFFVIMVILCLQALRYQQFNHAQNALLRRIDEFAALDGVSQSIISNLDVNELLNSIYENIRNLLPISSFVIAIYDADREYLTFPLVMIDGKSASIEQASFLQPQLERVINSGKVIRQRLLEELSATEFVGLPIQAGDEVLGAVCLQSESENAFDETDMRLLQSITVQAGLALRNAMLYDRSVNIAKSLERMHAFVHEAAFNIDIDEVLATASRVAVELVDADRGAVFYRSSSNGHSGTNDHGENDIAVYAHRVSESFNDLALKWSGNFGRFTQGSLIVNEIGVAHDPVLKSFANLEGFASIAEFPLRMDSTLIGALVVYNDVPRHFSDSEVRLLETLSYQVVASIENSILVRTLENYASQQAQLVHLSRISTESLDIRESFSSVASLLSKIITGKHIYIGVLDQNGRHLRFIMEDQPQLMTIPREEIIPEAKNFIEGRDDAHLYRAEELPEGLQKLLRICGDKTAAFSSLVANGQLQGIIVVGEPEGFHKQDAQMLEVIAHQIASQVHNVRAYEFVQSQLERRLQHLALIEDISREITRTLNVKTMIEYVLDAMRQSTQADETVVILPDKTNVYRLHRFLEVDGVWQYESEVVEHISEPVKRCIENKQRVVISDAELQHYDNDQVYTYASAAVVPMVHDEQVVGVLEALSKHPSQFTSEHMSFLDSLAGHVVVSIENANLLRDRQREIDTLKRLREISLKISSDTARYTVIQLMLSAAMDIVPAEYCALYSSREQESIAQLFSARRDNKPFSDPDILIPDALLRDAIESEKIVVLPDVFKDSVYQDYEHRRFIRYTGLIIAPIQRSGATRELITLMFTDPQIDILSYRNAMELLSIQAAGHLENNELYEQVRSNNDRMSAILDASNDGILLLDRRGHLVQWNVSAERILGTAMDEFAGRDFAHTLIERLDNEELGSDDARLGLEKMAETLRLEPERITRQQYELPREQGSVIYVDEVGSPVLNAQNEIMGRLLVLRDITEQKHLEDYREEITQMVIHDLRGPLTSIISSLTLALEVVGDPADTIEAVLTPMLDVSLDSGESLLRLVDSLLDIAKLENASMPLNREDVAMPAVSQSAVDALDRLIEEAGLEVILRFPEGMPPAFVDQDKIRRVMINLLDNAVRYSPVNGKILIEGQYHSADQYMRISVTDSGKGIPVEERDQVFQKFHQIKNNMPSRGRKGTGIGLTFCKLALEAHGGQIHVDAHPELSGASFVFTLPVAQE